MPFAETKWASLAAKAGTPRTSLQTALVHALKAPFQVPDIDLDIMRDRIGAGSGEVRGMTAILLARELGVELLDTAVDRLQLENLRRRRLPGCEGHPLQEVQHHPGIQRIGLGPLHARASKVFDRPRVDHRQLDPLRLV